MVGRPFAAGQFADRRILTVVNLRLPIPAAESAGIQRFSSGAGNSRGHGFFAFGFGELRDIVL